MEELRECFLDKRVQALAAGIGQLGEMLMEFRADSQIEAAGELTAGSNPLFATDIQVHFQRLAELAAQFGGGLAVEVGSAVEAENLASKLVEFGVVNNASGVAGDGHGAHGVTLFQAEKLLLRYGPVQRLRTLDALHLAVALDLRDRGLAQTLVSADALMVAVAVQEGLTIINPLAPA